MMATDLFAPKTHKEWICDANKAVELKLVRSTDSLPPGPEATKQNPSWGSSEEENARTFHPEFTYPIYGDDEQIFGYKNLTIRLHYAAASLHTYLGLSYSSRIEDRPTSSTLDGAKSQDVLQPLVEKLPKGYCEKYADFMEKVKVAEVKFTPLGTKIHEYRKGDDADTVFEVYTASFGTPGFKEFHHRMEIFLLFFIEAASYIDDGDEGWEIITIFERRKMAGRPDALTFVGYCTIYPFYFHPFRRRMRISQFLILPPFQKNGHGSELYSLLYRQFLSRKDVEDFTVEDPNDSFQEMRDKLDVQHLLAKGAFRGMKAPISREDLEAARKEHKLWKTQLHRCCEMVLLRNLDKQNAEDYRAYRLFVKARLYIKNEEVLESMDRAERNQKLQETFKSVEEGYRATLKKIS